LKEAVRDKELSAISDQRSACIIDFGIGWGGCPAVFKSLREIVGRQVSIAGASRPGLIFPTIRSTPPSKG